MRIDFVSIAHLVALVFDIIELGLIAKVSHDTTSRWWSWPRVSFMVFNAVWTLVVLAYVGLTPIFMTKLYHNMVSLALNAITMVFWFAGSIALAVLYGAPECNGSTFCGVVEAAIAFGFFLWAIFAFLTVIDVLEAFGRGANATSTARKPAAHPGA